MNNCYNTSRRENDNIYMRMLGNMPKNEDSSSDSEFSDFDDRLDEGFIEIIKERKNQEKTKEAQPLRRSHSPNINCVTNNNHVRNGNEEMQEINEKSSAPSTGAAYVTSAKHGFSDNNRTNVDLDSSKNTIVNSSASDRVTNVVIEEVDKSLPTVPSTDANVTQGEFDSDIEIEQEDVISPVSDSSFSTINTILDMSSENAINQIIRKIDKENASYVVDSTKPLSHTVLNNTTEDEGVQGGTEFVKEEEPSQILYNLKNTSSITPNDSVPEYNRVSDAVIEEIKEGTANHAANFSNLPLGILGNSVENEIEFRGNEEIQEITTNETTSIADKPPPTVHLTGDNITRTEFTPDSNKEMEEIISPVSHSSSSSMDTSPSSIETILDSSDDNLNGCGTTKIKQGIEEENAPNIVNSSKLQGHTHLKNTTENGSECDSVKFRKENEHSQLLCNSKNTSSITESSMTRNDSVPEYSRVLDADIQEVNEDIAYHAADFSQSPLMILSKSTENESGGGPNKDKQVITIECFTSNEDKSFPTVQGIEIISPLSHSSYSSIKTILDSSYESVNGHDATEILSGIEKDDTSNVLDSSKALSHTTMNNTIENGTIRGGIESMTEVREEHLVFVVDQPLSTLNKSITEAEVSRPLETHNAIMGKVKDNFDTDTSYSEINTSVVSDVDESKWTDVESDGMGNEEGNSVVDTSNSNKYGSVRHTDIDDSNWTDFESDENT